MLHASGKVECLLHFALCVAHSGLVKNVLTQEDLNVLVQEVLTQGIPGVLENGVIKSSLIHS